MSCVVYTQLRNIYNAVRATLTLQPWVSRVSGRYKMSTPSNGSSAFVGWFDGVLLPVQRSPVNRWRTNDGRPATV